MQKLATPINSQPLPETQEFVTPIFRTIATGVQQFKDGVQVSDIIPFVPLAALWQKGIEGFADNFKGEAQLAQPTDIEGIFNPNFEILVDAGIEPLLAYTIVNNLKGIYAVYAVAAQSSNKEEAI